MSCKVHVINIYSIEYLDVDRRSEELFRHLNKESKNRMKLLNKKIRRLQTDLHVERQRSERFLQNEELGLEKTNPKVESGPTKFRIKMEEELYI